MSSQQQSQSIHKSRQIARQSLHKQKLKTGVAILGKPIKQFYNDVKFQRIIKEGMIKQGEVQAQAALTTELLVLDVAHILRSD